MHHHYFSLAWLMLALHSATAQFPPQQVVSRQSTLSRARRIQYHPIKECITVASEEGVYFHEAVDNEGTVCGVYLLTDPERSIQVRFDWLDVPCEDGGLVSFVDGWELNQQFFPSAEDHSKPLNMRYREFCGPQKQKEIFQSSQNAALVQYRIPTAGRGFSFRVRFPLNSTPCNILLEGKSDVYTLRNYGKAVNCTLLALYPAHIRVLSLSVGLVDPHRHLDVETGTIRKCQDRGLADYAELGGAEGLDTTHLNVDDSICGTDSRPGSTMETILCGVSAVRLVSSGEFENAVTVAVRQAHEGDLDTASVICDM
ncbi:corticotropin-releasing factor-binding protein [Anabrus simplex]|uniref:corticotropin-releasing factor-binding protein n=1 Tax=Anabrus simplex TaxID=316456 RepID=UPI0035A2A850